MFRSVVSLFAPARGLAGSARLLNQLKQAQHLEFLQKFYTPELLQLIKVAETAVSPADVMAMKKRGFRGKLKIGVLDVDSDYSKLDPKWEEPIVYPNQGVGRTPYPQIPQIQGPDRTDLVLRFPQAKAKGKRQGNPTTREMAADLAKLTGLDARYIEKLYVRPIIMKRVSCQTGKGKIASFFVLTVVGDGNGTVGLGIGKLREGVRVAARKAHWNAVKNLTPIPRYDNRTILGEIEYKYHAVKMFIKLAPVGFGLRVNPNIFEICQAAGIKDLRGKIYKLRNPVLVCQGFVEALTKQRRIEDLAAGRGKKIVDLRKVYYSA